MGLGVLLIEAGGSDTENRVKMTIKSRQKASTGDPEPNAQPESSAKAAMAQSRRERAREIVIV